MLPRRSFPDFLIHFLKIKSRLFDPPSCLGNFLKKLLGNFFCHVNETYHTVVKYDGNMYFICIIIKLFINLDGQHYFVCYSLTELYKCSQNCSDF